MSQQIGIVAVVDIKAALKANKLDGNIYMLDNLRTEGSEGEGTGDLITAANGCYWYDGSQANEVVFNWLISGIGSLPQTLPKQYQKIRTKLQNKKALKSLNIIKNKENVANLKEKETLEKLKNMDISASKIQDHFGNSQDYGVGALTITGNHYVKGKSEEPISYLDPIITDITGEAVDKGVIYPAQYGSPVSVKDGWYWSATTDTSKVGVYSYTLHITLYKPKYNEETAILEWQPVEMTYESKIKVTNTPKVNGFTNGGMAELPIF